MTLYKQTPDGYQMTVKMTAKEVKEAKRKRGDFDGDGVLDIMDCAPFDPKRDGFWGDIVDWAKARLPTTPTPTPAPAPTPTPVRAAPPIVTPALAELRRATTPRPTPSRTPSRTPAPVRTTSTIITPALAELRRATTPSRVVSPAPIPTAPILDTFSRSVERAQLTPAGLPDAPGEAKAKMIAAGVLTPTGAPKAIVGHYKDPSTGTYKFIAAGEPLPTYKVPAAAEAFGTRELEAFHTQLESAARQKAAEEALMRGDWSKLTYHEQAAFGIGMFGGAAGIALGLERDSKRRLGDVLMMPVRGEELIRYGKDDPSLVSGKDAPGGFIITDMPAKWAEYEKKVGQAIGGVVGEYGGLMEMPHRKRDPKDVLMMPVRGEELIRYGPDVPEPTPGLKTLDDILFGAYKAFQEKPLTIAATAAAFTLAAPGIATVAAGASRIPMIGGVVSGYAVPAAVTAVGALYAGDVQRRMWQLPTDPEELSKALERRQRIKDVVLTGVPIPESLYDVTAGAFVGKKFKGEAFGRILVGELAPMSAGAWFGSRHLMPWVTRKVIQPGRVKGKEYVPLKEITTPEVLSGAHQFPQPRPGTTSKEMVRLFEQMQFEYKLPGEPPTTGVRAWHVTAGELPKKFEVIPGERKTTGLFVAPAASTYFARIGVPEFKLLGLGIPRWTKPTVVRPEIMGGVGQVPAHVQRKGIGAVQKWLASEAAKRGRAYITPEFARGKPEMEAVISIKTQAARAAERYYTEIEGMRVPIHEYRFGVDAPKKPSAVETKKRRLVKRDYKKGEAEYPSEVSLSFMLAGAEIRRKMDEYAAVHRKVIEYRPPSEIRPPREYRLPTERRMPTEIRVPREYRPPSEIKVPREYRPPSEYEPPSEIRVPSERRLPSEIRVPSERRLPSEIRVPPYEYRLPPPPPTIFDPDDPEKRALRKRKKAKPEYWQIRNPIATMSEILWGRGSGRASPEKKSKKGGKKK